ncbi:UDP-N-acetylmuramate dehydrogenase [Planctomycetota bacterium]
MDCKTEISAPHIGNTDTDQHSDMLACLRVQNIPFRINEPLGRHCTWRIGGPTDLLAEPQSVAQVALLIRRARDLKMPFVVIGKGSNLLFNDSGLRGLVIKIDRGLSRISINGRTVTAQAGIAMPRLAHRLGRAGLGGLEHTVGIPGNLGGLVVMNGGSLRQNIGDVITSVTYVDEDGNLQTRGQVDCDFSYRNSWFLHHAGWIVEVSLELLPKPAAELMPVMLDILRTRRKHFPLQYPNCGSVFKNSDRLFRAVGPPGRAIESLGLKGRRNGGLEISARHANFFINRDQGTCRDALGLIDQVSGLAARHLGCGLEAEVRYVDSQGRIQPAHLANLSAR